MHAMTTDVAIVGGGPTGLMLGAELALAGVRATIVERRATQALVGSRAGGLHARTIEVLDMRGIADRFLAEGTVAQVVGFNRVTLDIGDLPTRHPYGLALWQNHIERLLAERAAELDVRVLRERDVVDVVQDDAGARVVLADGGALRAAWVVGCDGGRSVVRRAAGIEFAGWDATTSWLIAEASVRTMPPLGFHRDAVGTHAIGPVGDGRVRAVLVERAVGAGGEPTLDDVRAAIVAAYGTDFGIHDATWVSRFTDATRQAVAYRRGRVLLAGDAAHVHAPVGGQGLNLGVQDAVNLGWKLAQVVRGASPEALLDTYHAERHPVAARALRTTMAQVALGRTDDRTAALGDVLAPLLALDAVRHRLGAELSGLDVRYDLGAGHPLLGRRLPDVELDAPVDTPAGARDGAHDAARRAYTLLHDARPLLLDLAGRDAPRDGAIDAGAWRDRVRVVRATSAGPWTLPLVGAVPAPAAVLVRPDGHVAWVGDGTRAGLDDALRTWVGAPA